MKNFWIALGSIGIIVGLILLVNHRPVKHQESKRIRVSGAGQSLDNWSMERAYPNQRIPISKYKSAYAEKVLIESQRTDDFSGEWESLGPENVGGRTLCLAFHPTEDSTIFAGTASGGLWKTTTMGIGQYAWTYIPTGFPVSGVASIWIDYTNPNVMYIGTGEVYGAGFAEPGIINRLVRGTYGIGILKSTDGGLTWAQSLAFNQDDIKGVQDIVASPNDPNVLLAATTDGVYKSINAGESWELTFAEPNCIDLEMHHNNSNIVYVTQGNFNESLDPELSGIFKSTDQGESFTELLDDGLSPAWSGNAKLTIDPVVTDILYASIQVGWFNQDPTTPGGIYKSVDAGVNWNKINDQNIAFWQGWYSHDIAVNPNNLEEMMYVGIDTWKSTDGGSFFSKKTSWQGMPFGELSVEEPQGGDDYVHGDIHAVYYHPTIEDKIFFATDGGVFSSDDGGETFTTHNGGLQTTQFYPNMGSSTSDPNLCIAGAQDNATYIYRGTPSWWRVIGGDGMSAAIRPDDDNVMFGSYQRLNIRRSTNQGYNFSPATPTLNNDFAAFLGPYEIAPSNNDIMYAGATFLYQSTSSGSSWSATSSQSIDGSNVIVKIAISHSNPNKVFLCTSPDPLNPGNEVPKLFRTIDGGQNFEELTNLPDRICKDIEVDPNDDDIVYAVFSGFGTNHVYKSTNGGTDWLASDVDLPDLPTNTIAIDPSNSDIVYVGNDIGVFVSENGGENWSPFCNSLPEATMIMDLNISPANNKLRIATHGHGIWQRDLLSNFTSIASNSEDEIDLTIFPNPAMDAIQVNFTLPSNFQNVDLSIMDIRGKTIETMEGRGFSVGENLWVWNRSSQLSSGTYFVVINIDGKKQLQKLLLQ